MTEIEKEIAAQREKCLATLEKLRAANFDRGIPFQMLNEKLPKGQAYYQYPDGHVEIRELITGKGKPYTEQIRILTNHEGAQILQDYGLQ
jgi:hypothetical protein